MSHWPYIAAAYVLTIGGMAALVLVSWLRMRRAEAQADTLSRSSRAQSRGVGTGAEQHPSTSLGTSGTLS
ncbi:heme exporter protein CcmD [Sphingomonas sp. ID1715]|uniref:heme exporter protein CcmD n=1 Tax=Sphingomonas sp. ID1715 TaxID=1656898 RepID=UPI001C2B988D|nr:heme exporter protein CcmD [Sphingomonas sp. ID1715]